MRRPRVLLAEDYRLLREAFAQLLQPCCELVGVVGDGRAVLALAPDVAPDIVVLDIAMPLLNGLDAARQLKKTMPEVKVIFLTVNEDADLAREALRAGAAGYLLKSSAASELIEAIGEVSRGRTYVTSQVSRGCEESGAAPARKADDLSHRQREVLQLLAEGHSMKKVARILHITPRTVAFHKYAIMAELGIKSSAELVQFAVREHVVSA